MKKSFYLLIPIFLILGCQDMSNKNSKEIGIMQFPEGEVQHVVHADEINWAPCPPGLPENCLICVLEGSPKSADLFSVRFQFTKDIYLPAHTHTKDERVTILKGNAYVAFGKGATQEDATVFKAGDYYVNARNEIHTVWADSGAVLQITGIGPWEVDFID